MSTGRLVAFAVVILLGWQQQASIAAHLGPLENAVPRVRSFLEMRRYVAELEPVLEEEGRPPEDLAAWLDDRFLPEGGRPASIDPFGLPYRVDRDRSLGWVLRSCGPDGACLTEDDLVKPLRNATE